MEKLPEEKSGKRTYPIERIIGPGFDEEDFEIAADIWRERFDVQQFVDTHEREKTKDDMVSIAEVNEATNQLLEAHGVVPLDIPAKNVHIIATEHWPEAFEGSEAFYSADRQALAYCDRGWHSVLPLRVYHEMLHIKSHQAMQYYATAKSSGFIPYRSGMAVQSERYDFAPLFARINEAVIETLATWYWQDSVATNPRFENEMRKLDAFKEMLRTNIDAYAAENHISRDTAESQIDSLIYFQQVGEHWQNYYFSYRSEREALEELVQLLAKRSGKTEKDVFQMFVKSMLTGHMVELAKFIDGISGAGSFKHLGEISRGGKFIGDSAKNDKVPDADELIAYIRSM